ncbi:hypothetical protein PRVXT_002611 [Proteinivorax tanatarense]|uniref:Uncharacterized protein n=1 Tax=Proteinivorax tanatarense TaxID=1260629 RepID=A0AAU7VKJ8_9FIRM
MNKHKFSDIVKKIYKVIGATGMLILLVIATNIAGWTFFLIANHPDTAIAYESQTLTIFLVIAAMLFFVTVIDKFCSKKHTNDNQNI